MAKSKVELINCSVLYGKNEVFNDINLKLNSAEVYVIVGPNGAGKTTLLKVIVGLKSITSGNVVSDYKRFGYTPEKFTLPYLCSATEFLSDLAISCDALITAAKLNKELREFNLPNIKTFRMSKGMKQKLALIQSYILDQDLIILDEPLNGLDQESVDMLFNKIETLKRRGATIVIVTHLQDSFKKLKPNTLRVLKGDIRIE